MASLVLPVPSRRARQSICNDLVRNLGDPVPYAAGRLLLNHHEAHRKLDDGSDEDWRTIDDMSSLLMPGNVLRQRGSGDHGTLVGLIGHVGTRDPTVA